MLCLLAQTTLFSKRVIASYISRHERFFLDKDVDSKMIDNCQTHRRFWPRDQSKQSRIGRSRLFRDIKK